MVELTLGMGREEACVDGVTRAGGLRRPFVFLEDIGLGKEGRWRVLLVLLCAAHSLHRTRIDPTDM